MKRNEVVNINKEYLREIVSRSGFDQIEFSRRIGRYDRYVKNCMYTGRMDENAAKLVCSMFNRDEKKTDYQRRTRGFRRGFDAV